MFGRFSNVRGDSAFPQVQAVYLVECGTHAVVDTGFWPCHTSERVGGLRMLRSVTQGMLLMWDKGFHSSWRRALDPDRLSFTNALSLVCDDIPEFQMVAVAQRPQLCQRLLGDIVRYKLPHRDHRSNPRVVKRKMSKFKLKRPEHRQWPQPSKTFREAIVMLN